MQAGSSQPLSLMDKCAGCARLRFEALCLPRFTEGATASLKFLLAMLQLLG
jgi:hypothetical protein